MEFVKTDRGARKLLHEGFAYTIDKKHGDITYWRCEKRSECGARLKTIDDVIQGNPYQHSHPPNDTRIAESC